VKKLIFEQTENEMAYLYGDESNDDEVIRHQSFLEPNSPPRY